jgi:hypothetical protein
MSDADRAYALAERFWDELLEDSPLFATVVSSAIMSKSIGR